MKLRGRFAAAAAAGALIVGGGALWLIWPESEPVAVAPEPGTPVWDRWQQESTAAGRLAQLAIVQRGEVRSRELCAAEWSKLRDDQHRALDRNAFEAGCVFSAPQP
ncbi:hypothetical protein AB0O82_10855 [Kitasatospora sp. NPDC088264]|uniref:hypothetical protein n=1 Tax=Kitasatospora sp. NPDC088264 TaxID=3155296 RepID=UPI00342F7949